MDDYTEFLLDIEKRRSKTAQKQLTAIIILEAFVIAGIIAFSATMMEPRRSSSADCSKTLSAPTTH